MGTLLCTRCTRKYQLARKAGQFIGGIRARVKRFVFGA
jgi:hypothetical protein